MIEMLRIYSKGFLEDIRIEELPPNPLMETPFSRRSGKWVK
jgi:hypothetical protein